MRCYTGLGTLWPITSPPPPDLQLILDLLDRGSFLDNGKIVLISVLVLREVTIELNLASKKVTTKYSHLCDSAQIKSAHAHTNTQSMTN
jgi:hypothetical protein